MNGDRVSMHPVLWKWENRFLFGFAEGISGTPVPYRALLPGNIGAM